MTVYFDRRGGEAAPILLWLRRYAPAAVFAMLLGACCILGGGSQFNATFVSILELLSLVCFLVAVSLADRQVISRDARALILMTVSFVALVCLQLIPIPWDLWKALPGHGAAANGATLLDLPKSARPLSIAPEHSVSALLKFIPAAAVFLIALRLPWRILFNMVMWGVPVAGVLSVTLGFAQIFEGVEAPLYLNETRTKGAPVGFFANINHQATFLLMCLPFVAALGAKTRSRWQYGENVLPLMVVLAGVAFVLLTGIAIAGSLAGYIFAPFVVAASVVLLSETPGKLDAKYLIAGLLLAIVALSIALFSPRLQGLGQGNYFGGERTRSAMHGTTLEAAVDFIPLGSGLGSFEKVYPLYEDEDTIEPTFVNHAHNEYLEILLELGLPGMALVLLFVAWWVRATFRTWLSQTEYGSFQMVRMAASLAIAVVLVHSLMDYPIRTMTISSFVAVCVAIMVRTRTGQREPDVVPLEPV